MTSLVDGHFPSHSCDHSKKNSTDHILTVFLKTADKAKPMKGLTVSGLNTTSISSATKFSYALFQGERVCNLNVTILLFCMFIQYFCNRRSTSCCQTDVKQFTQIQTMRSAWACDHLLRKVWFKSNLGETDCHLLKVSWEKAFLHFMFGEEWLANSQQLKSN